MKRTLFCLMFTPLLTLTSLTSQAQTDLIFKTTLVDIADDGSEQEIEVSSVLKDGGKAAAITINTIEFTFPQVGMKRCAGCMGTFADSFDLSKQTIRFTLWAGGNGNNSIEMEKFDYNPRLIMSASFKTFKGNDVSLNAFESLDASKALLSVDGSSYVLNQILMAKCPDCLGFYSDVAEMADINSAKILLTLYNNLAIEGAHIEINKFNYDKLFNNTVTYTGATEEGYKGYSFQGYLANDGQSVLLNLGWAAQYVLKKIDQPRCLGCRGLFADVDSLADLEKAEIAVYIWDKFRSDGSITHSIEFTVFKKTYPSPY